MDKKQVMASPSGPPADRSAEKASASGLGVGSDAGPDSQSRLIGTTGRFNLLDLPVEIRLQIYADLLLYHGDLVIDGDPAASPAAQLADTPHVAILRTCRLINDEANPLLYGRRQLTIRMPTHTHPSDLNPPFLFSTLRWSTLRLFQQLRFQSAIKRPKTTSPSTTMPSTPPILPLPLPLSITTSPLAFTPFAHLAPALVTPPPIVHTPAPARPPPTFACTGTDLLARFSPNDPVWSPVCPDVYMALSLTNWLSTQIMKAELEAFQRELEAIVRPAGLLIDAGFNFPLPGTGVGIDLGAGI